MGKFCLANLPNENITYLISTEANSEYGRYTISIESDTVANEKTIKMTQIMKTVRTEYIKVCRLELDGSILSIRKLLPGSDDVLFEMEIEPQTVKLKKKSKYVKMKYQGALYAVTASEVVFRGLINKVRRLKFKGLTNSGAIMDFVLEKVKEEMIDTPCGQFDCETYRLYPAGIFKLFVKPFYFSFSKDPSRVLVRFIGKFSAHEPVVTKIIAARQ